MGVTAEDIEVKYYKRPELGESAEAPQSGSQGLQPRGPPVITV